MFSGLNLAKPRFEWDCHDRLTELEHFKENCQILFEGPLSDMKDKPRAGLIINWLSWCTNKYVDVCCGSAGIFIAVVQGVMYV